MDRRRGFKFGLEAEFALVEADSLKPLWYPDLKFQELNGILEGIPISDVATEGLKVETPHRKEMPYVVEGYHMPARDLKPVDILPKGIEVRTPVTNSPDECVRSLCDLYSRLQQALAQAGYTAVPISFHPLHDSFDGPQNKRRHDFWQWAMEAMVTYGPDINVHLPQELLERLDMRELDGKVNYYGPAITALALASPIFRGGLWTIRGRVGKSVRTYHRSVIAPAIEVHPDQQHRLEFKLFDMPFRLQDFRGFLLLWLTLLLDEGLSGRASKETRVYDLGSVAKFGLQAETVSERAAEVLQSAPSVLDAYGFDPTPLKAFQKRLETNRLPADDIIDLYRQEQSVPDVLRQLSVAA